MNITFQEEGHVYKDQNDPDFVWISVTSLISKFENHFDPIAMSEQVSKKRGSKWFGMKPEKIREVWDAENERSTVLGSWYHDKKERELCEKGTVSVGDVTLTVFKPKKDKTIKRAHSQVLKPGIYPEHIVYLKTIGIIGQGDIITVHQGKVHIRDHKTNKKIDRESYVDRLGRSKKMLSPLNHLDDCNLVHYSLQLSLYMYIILQHNPKLKPGKMELKHITFKQMGKDTYGFPLYEKDENGEFIIEKIETYSVPYLYEEVVSMINHYKFMKNDRSV